MQSWRLKWKDGPAGLGVLENSESYTEVRTSTSITWDVVRGAKWTQDGRWAVRSPVIQW